MRTISLCVVLLALALASCKPLPKASGLLEPKDWGKADGKAVKLYTLVNKNGMKVSISNFGGVITAIEVPDKTGKIENVVLGFDSLAAYQAEHPYFGSFIGRYGNRIAKAQFTLNGAVYHLAANNGVNSLHGGAKGFNKRVLTIDTAYSHADTSVLALSYTSPDGEEGYPGNLKVKLVYSLCPDNELQIKYEAETDKPTVLNLTNHSYFNLTAGKESILGHELVLHADSITPVDDQLIPTGILSAVEGTAFDFKSAHQIGERIAKVPGGYDINFKLNKMGKELALAAEVYEPKSGRFLQAYTTEPGLQFYSGNFLDGKITGSRGIRYQQYHGLCLEAQHFPDSPNQAKFPSVVLNPGEQYTQLTVYKFSVK